MKIVVALASRGRPAALAGVVMAAHRLSSGKHDLRFVLGLDDDDPDVAGIEKHLATEPDLKLYIAAGEAPTVRGQVENRMLRTAEGLDITEDGEVGAVTLMTDRTFPIQPGWDAIMASAAFKASNRVLWWSCQEDNGCVIPIIPRTLAKALDWQWDNEVHPYWFSDTAQQEIDLMIHGMPSLKAKCVYAGSRGRTRNAREFALWFDVFTATRRDRREIANTVAQRLGLKCPLRPDVEAYFQTYDKVMRERIPVFEQNFADLNEPDANYLAAKERAELLLKELA